MGVFGDIAWRKWRGVLTDEVPQGSLLGISPGYKATPKCQDDSVFNRNSRTIWHEQSAEPFFPRLGEDVKYICLGGIHQVDNPHLKQENSGLNWMV
jgi:hypothetical protein